MARMTFEERERPILEAINDLEEEGKHRKANVDTLAQRVGIEPNIVGRAMQSLIEGGFVDAIDASSMGGPDFLSPRLLPKGKAQVGAWPATPAEAFLARLDDLIANTTDEEERGRLERLKGDGRDVAKGVLSSAIVAAAQFGSGI